MTIFTDLRVLGFKRSLPFTTYLLLVAFAFIGYGTKADSAQNTHKFEQFANNVKQNSKQTEIRVGYQKGTAYLNILKARGSLEKRLNPTGVAVKWIEFTQGPPMMEAMNAGAVDIGVVGAPPPIFAQAAGVPVTYVASSLPTGKSQVILVKKNSAIRTVADLKWTFQRRPNFGVLYMNDQIVKEQQQMADLFFNLKLIPKPVQVKEAVWKP
jgi:sulfonate transport system substrate-binding protein